MSQRAAVQRSIDVVVSWADTPVCVERLACGESFTIGAAPPTSSANKTRHFLFHHASLPSSSFPLVEHRADAVIVRAAEGMALLLGGAPIPSRELTLARGARARVNIGPLRVDVAGDKRAPTVVDRARDLVDGRLLRLSGVAMALHAGFVIALLFTRSPDPVDPFAGKGAARWTSTSTPPPSLSLSLSLSPSKATPRAAAETKSKDNAASSSELVRRATQHTKKAGVSASARDLAMNAIAQMFTSTDATSKVFGENGVAHDLGGLTNGAAASIGGDAGTGVRRGPGGIGNGAATIGAITGRFGDSDGASDGDVTLSTRKHKVVVDTFAPPVQSGDGLTREEIQRVLKRVMPQIKYCYEKELNREPSLEGKVTSSFTITRDGNVIGAQVSSSTMQRAGGDQVGACVTRILSRLVFPAPRGGGQVVVTYPFVFSTAGAR